MQSLNTPAELRRQTARLERSLGRLSVTLGKRQAAAAAERKRLEDAKLERLGSVWWNQ
jgi:hypothetical protein